jgi:hypothetical protein
VKTNKHTQKNKSGYQKRIKKENEPGFRSCLIRKPDPFPSCCAHQHAHRAFWYQQQQQHPFPFFFPFLSVSAWGILWKCIIIVISAQQGRCALN